MRAVLLCAVLLGCATHRIPEPLRGYEVLVEGRDEQSVELARALRASGFRVRDHVRGGGRPTLALIYFTFCFFMSRYSQWLEKKVNVGVRRR